MIPCLPSYSGTENLGDAVQTIALHQLLGSPNRCAYKDRDSNFGVGRATHNIVNGYLDGRWKPRFVRTWFVGIHVSTLSIAARVKAIALEMEVGARDPHSATLLAANGARVRMIGCATLALPRYDGPRAGVLHIDDGHPDQLTQHLPKNASWLSQWWEGCKRLRQLETAALVHTRRLHVALPCLAFGTPVQMPADTLRTVSNPERLGLLDVLGFRYGTPQTIDVSALAGEYIAFLGRCGVSHFALRTTANGCESPSGVGNLFPENNEEPARGNLFA